MNVVLLIFLKLDVCASKSDNIKLCDSYLMERFITIGPDRLACQKTLIT